MSHVLTRRRLLGSCAALGFASLADEDADAQSATRPSGLSITRVETFAVEYKLPRAIGVSIALMPSRRAVLVKITTDSGLVGWGETIDTGGTRAAIESKLKPLLLGKNPLEHRKLWRELWGANFGDGRAVAGVDLALHDVRGKALGQSVAEMYGGRVRDRVLAYAAAMNYTQGVEPEDQFPAEAAGLARQGFRALKIRTGRFEPRRDLAVLAKVREAVGPDIRLLTDGNGAFTLPAAVRFGRELEKLDFYCFEEPLPQNPNYAGYDVLAQSLDIAIAGGEVLDARASAREHLVRRSFDIIQPDVILCGGIGEVLFIAEMARLFSIQCVPHCWSGAIAIAATLQVLSLLPSDTHGFTSDGPMLELDTSENPLRTELVARPPAIGSDGQIGVPTGAGLGIEIVEEAVRKYAAGA